MPPEVAADASATKGAVNPDLGVITSPKRSPAPSPAAISQAAPLCQEGQARKDHLESKSESDDFSLKYFSRPQHCSTPSGLPLSSQAWESLSRIFYRLAQQNKEAVTAELISAIRADVRVRNEGLLHRPVTSAEESGIPAISLDAALQQVSSQVQLGTGHMDMVTWDRFYWLLLEAHRYRASPHLQPASKPFAASQSLPDVAFSMASCPVNPNEAPGASIQTLP